MTLATGFPALASGEFSGNIQQIAVCNYVENSQPQQLKVFMRNGNRNQLLATLSGKPIAVNAVQYVDNGATLQMVAAVHILISIPKGAHTQNGHIGVMLGTAPAPMNCTANW